VNLDLLTNRPQGIAVEGMGEQIPRFARNDKNLWGCSEQKYESPGSHPGLKAVVLDTACHI
jgi:hypothetical protein